MLLHAFAVVRFHFFCNGGVEFLQRIKPHISKFGIYALIDQLHMVMAESFGEMPAK